MYHARSTPALPLWTVYQPVDTVILGIQFQWETTFHQPPVGIAGIAAKDQTWWGRGNISQSDVTPSWHCRLPDSGKPGRQSRAASWFTFIRPDIPLYPLTRPQCLEIPSLPPGSSGHRVVMVREARHAVNHGKELSASSRSSYPSHRFPGWHFHATLKPPHTANQCAGTGMTAAGQRQYRGMRRKRGLSLYLSQGRRMPSIGNPRYWLCSCAAYNRSQRKRFNRR